MRHGLLTERSRVVGTEKRVACEHAKACWKGLDGLLVTARSLEVVDGHASVLLDSVKGAVLGLIEERWGPIV